MSLFVHISTTIAVAGALRTRRQDAGTFQSSQHGVASERYTFDDFTRDFGRTYASGLEFSYRAAIFQDSLSQILAENSRIDRSWTAGVHPFMDWTDAERAERLHGYEPRASHRSTGQGPLSAMQTGAGAEFAERLYGVDDDSFEAAAPPVRDQGGLCGSCWAFSAVAAVEAQLWKSGSPWSWENGEPHLSVQALLDCAPNPNHCGGKGGCFGATPEVAFDFMRDTGVPTDENLPYHPLHKGKCPIQPYPATWQRVTLAGWRALPSNQAQPLMQALVQDGPVVVAVDAHKDWYHYESGIYDGCPKDAILNHGLLAKGYGVQAGKKYWRLQNSWGTKWGEQGTIRIVRHDDESGWCGTDSRPEEGFACEGDQHRNVTVCGSCGLLFDMTIPQVGHVTVGQDVSSAPSSTAPASLKQDATSGLDLLKTYSDVGASAGVASESLSVKLPSASSAAMPGLNEQGLVDSHDRSLEVSDAAAAFRLPQLQPMTTAQHFTVEPAVDSMTDLVDLLPTEDQKPHTPQHFAVEPTVDSMTDLVDLLPTEDQKPHTAQHFAVEPTVDSMTDLVDLLPTEDQKPQAQMLPTHDVSSVRLPTEVNMADAVHAGIMDWSSSQAAQKRTAAQPETFGQSWFAWTGQSDLTTSAAVSDLHLKDTPTQDDASSTSFADHISSIRSLAGKMPFRSLKATDSMDVYERLTD